MRNIMESKWLLAVIFILFDLYILKSLNTFLRNGHHAKWAPFVVVILSLLAIIQLLLLFLVRNDQSHFQSYALSFIVAVLLFQLSTCIFLLIDDIRRMITFLILKINASGKSAATHTTEIKIPRSAFLTWAGTAIGTAFMGSLAYGLSNKYNYRIHRIKQHFPNLPSKFKGLKIVQISDIHSGSFTNPKAVARGVAMVNAEKPDLILFTGDLVNNRASEMTAYKTIFSALKAPLGVYSTLGNHDYGDYVQWPSAEAKKENLEQLKQVHADMGWHLMMNEHVIFDREEQKIALIGIENWGAKGHFPKYGKMDKAYPGTENIPFKILMSHDPSHWDAEVRPKYPDIDLTLAGHTHGMQFGVEIPGFQWSPIKYMYPEWAGLYQKGSQYLYVNRGFGFIGYPGRVGILPEITVLELV